MRNRALCAITVPRLRRQHLDLRLSLRPLPLDKIGFSNEASARTRHLIPNMPVQGSSGLLLVPSTPLLEKERHAGIQTLITDLADPLGCHRPCPVARLTAQDNPVNEMYRRLR